MGSNGLLQGCEQLSGACIQELVDRVADIHDVAEGREFVVIVVRQGMGISGGSGGSVQAWRMMGERVDHMAWRASCSRW